MGNLGFYLLLFLSFHYLTGTADPAVASNPSDFIKAACKTTLYPVLCITCLSSYASTIQDNEKQLAQAALSVSLAKAQSAAVFVTKFYGIRGVKPREYQAVKDCIDTMGDSVSQLSQSLREFGRMNRLNGDEDFKWHMSNVQTWVSAALTDDTTCLDGFSGPDMDGNLKDAISTRVTHVAQVTSNALALVNRFARKHKAGAATSATP